jgi:hypothetical protein
MDYSEHIYARRPRRNRKTKTLAELLKARKALDAKIAALKKANLRAAAK